MKKINKKELILIILLFCVLVFTSFNTFITNDDLSYSFLYHGNIRITNLSQVISSQISDYYHINGRFFIHCIIQALLIHGKKIWSILNPIAIVTLLYIVTKISNKYTKNKNNNLIKLTLSAILFLLLISYKYIIYWVAGSLNYIWVTLAIMLFIYYYLTKDIKNNFILNSIIILIVSILHEMSLVFMTVLILGNLILMKIQKKKISKKYIFYFISLIISATFILMSPGNHSRMQADSLWSSMNIFQKIFASTPVVSKNLFNLINLNNIIPLIFISSIIYKLVKTNQKKIAIILTILSLISAILNNGYVYTILTLITFLSESIINLKNKNYKWIIISLGFYAIVYSTIIVPNYKDARPNFFFYIYSIIVIINFYNDLLKSKTIKITLLCICLALMIKEVVIYNNIGNIHQERLENIYKCKKNNCKTLRLKKIPNKYEYYHIDINSPKDSSYYTYKYFIQYYKLPDGIVLEYYD